jgi:hypothetical protein
MPKTEQNIDDKARRAPSPVRPLVEAKPVDDPSDQSRDEGDLGPSFLEELPFERGFPPAGGAELTRSYIPALERAIEEKTKRRARKST